MADQYCERGNHFVPVETFISDSGRVTKTCQRCLSNISRKRKENTPRTLDAINDAEDPIALEDCKSELEKLANDAIISYTASIDMELGVCYENAGAFVIGFRDVLREATGFFFILRGVKRTKGNENHRYYCSQDKGREKPTKQKEDVKNRTRPKMTRFPCGGSLVINANTITGIATIKFHHSKHAPYTDVALPTEVIEYIRAHLDQTPQQLFEKVGTMSVHLTEAQVYYWWMKLNETNWVRDKDQFVSAMTNIAENRESIEVINISERHGVKGLGFTLKTAIECHGKNAYEVAIDATYKTNQKNMELVGLLTEVDGVGFPLGYVLLSSSDEIEERAKILALSEFLTAFQTKGINPKFVLTDKDSAEIAAIKKVWPSAKIQLCYWHALRTLKKRLSKNKKPKKYNPDCANKEFPFISKTFVHANIGMAGMPKPLTKFCPGEFREAILGMFRVHFNMHETIPASRDGHCLSAREIHAFSVKEMYQFCEEHDLVDTWAYLWSSWYRPAMWHIWAQSGCKEIPRLRTTMIVESHWRTIKHDYLHRFARPRLDLLVWILIKKLVPKYDRKATFLQSQTHRARGLTPWRKDFKEEWHQLHARASNSQYITDTARWTCSCAYFATSRFLTCKHLVQNVHPIPSNSMFFHEVQRNRQAPFYTHSDLNARVPFVEATHMLEGYIGNEESEGQLSDNSNDAGQGPVMPDTTPQDNDENTAPSSFETWAEEKEIMKARLNAALKLIDEQDQVGGNTKFLKVMNNETKGLARMIESVDRFKRRRTCPKTWSDTDKYTMYLKNI